MMYVRLAICKVRLVDFGPVEPLKAKIYIAILGKWVYVKERERERLINSVIKNRYIG